MTLDRHDENPHDDAEHGVLSDAGAVDTAGIGVLDGRTAQVNVILPQVSDDDLVDDDDVVDDEMPVDAVVTGEIVMEGIDAPIAHERTADVHDADEVVETDAQHEDRSEADREGDRGSQRPDDAENEPDTHIDDDEAGGGRVEDAGTAGPLASDDDGPEPSQHAASAQTTADGGEAAPPAAGQAVHGSARTPTGGIPATRREAHHLDEPGRVDRVHAAERVRPAQPEITLASKRLGEFDGGRESADLLTPDRLLDRSQLGGAEPEGLWQQLVYSLSRHRINLGDSRRVRMRKELDRRIGAPLTGGARFVPVLSRKGGVGKTTVTTLLGMALADARDDRIIAVDANPDRGTLADRIGRPSGRTVRDLARARGQVSGYNDISTIVARDETRLDVLASDADPRVSEAFSDRDYHDVAALAAHYYSIVLTDTGTGIVHSVMGATLELADELVVVAGLSVDEARLASETLTWLETNGYGEQVRNAVVVLNNARPGSPLVREAELEAHFRTRVRAVVRVPYDPAIATGSAISFRDLQPATRSAARKLAAVVVEGLRALAPVA